MQKDFQPIGFNFPSANSNNSNNNANANANNNGYYPAPTPQIYPDDFQNYSEDPASLAYLHAYLASPRPDAPIPPTPHSQTAAPSPSPFPGGYGKPLQAYMNMGMNMNMNGPVVPVPVVPVGSPYPYPFTHGYAQSTSSYDPNSPAAIQEQLAKQWQIYLQNQVNGNMTDSTFSPAATPFQGANYNPFTFLHTARLTRQAAARETMSLHSSPSHEPVPLPSHKPRKSKDTLAPVREVRQQVVQQPRRRPPPRVDSTQPRDTTPEPDSSGEETAGEYTGHSILSHTPDLPEPVKIKVTGDTKSSPVWSNGTTDSGGAGSTKVDVDDNSDDWIDEDDEADDSDVLDFEYHPNYIPNSDKRRRRWEVGWEGLVQAFQNLDRQTDTTMVVLAAPPHSSKLHSIRSRSIRRTSVLRNSVALSEMRAGFKRLTVQRKNLRPSKPQFLRADSFLEGQSSLNGDGSDGSTESREEDLKKALEVALGSLNMLNGMYEMRESRWQEEMKRMQEDKEKMAFYLNQVLGSFSLPLTSKDATPVTM
ncbi:hypothetical protein DFP72DRAFT_935716 [Ephemerocybe angulata]|uniref:Uncharacterized protein n=1 Tax=Ephemerocybe angulata TaxID=980116 RepID=A0A8H6HBZ3_9AGAR|nr:hypothetical protein DFP72DRAFT_935716 [Tulosesus angulatus]